MSFAMLLIRDFPIREDDAGFYYGIEPNDGRSNVSHRFTSHDFDQLAVESIEYFLSILPDAAHDQRQTLLENNIITWHERGE